MSLNGSLATVDAAGKIRAAVEDVTVPAGFNGGTPLTQDRALTITTATANLSKLAGLSYDTPGRLAESSAGPITAYVAGLPIDQQGRLVIANAPPVRYAQNAIPITASGAVAMLGGPPPDSTAPTDPTALVATPNSETQITLTWTASTDAVGVTLYRIERCTGAACANFAEIATDPASPYVDTGRSPATTYRYRIRAEDAALNLSGYSNIAQATTPDNTAPTVPGNLIATPVNETQVDLSWDPSTDNVGVTTYLLERCTGAGCSTFAEIAQPVPTNYSDTGRSANTTYRYQVRARDAANNRSGYSNIATATTPDNTAPTAPTALVATPNSETQVTLTWTAASDNVGVILYRIERCTGVGCSSFAEIATDNASPFVDTGLTVNTTYRYQIRAQDAALNLGPYSNIATALTPDQTAPTVPGSPVATALGGGSKIDLTWTASTDNVAVAGYNVERCAGAACVNFVEVGTPAASPFNDTGLTPLTVYRYQVRARDAVPNFSGYSSIAQATTLTAAITPADLFLAGEIGGWYDPSDISTLFQDTAAATPVTAAGQSVARINDKSGRGNHLLQATAGSRATYQVEGGRGHLLFDGTDDSYATSGVLTMTSANGKVTVWAGLYKDVNPGAGQVIELSPSSGSNLNCFAIQAPPGDLTGYFVRSRGAGASDGTVDLTTPGNVAVKTVLTFIADTGGDLSQIRVDGVIAGTTNVDQGTGGYTNYQLFVGRRNNAQFPFKGRMYGLIWRCTVTTTVQHVADIEQWMAPKVGITFTSGLP